jgi:Winged helix DNA-binding domain
MLDRQAVRIALMRSTVHLVSARDCLPLRRLVQPAIARTSRHTNLRRAAGVADAPLAAAGRQLLAEHPRTFHELGELLHERWRDCPADALAMGVRELVPLVQVPPRGLWRTGGAVRVADAEDWLGASAAAGRLAIGELVRRYLAAYGPASVRDVQTFTGLTGLRDVLEELRPALRTFRDESACELFDLPEAPLPTARRTAPVRFLPEFDNVLLSHADRSRILPDGTMSLLSLGNGLRPAFLVDGFVAGSWRLVRRGSSAVLEVRPFEPPGTGIRRELAAEAERLLAFAAADAEHRSVRWT